MKHKHFWIGSFAQNRNSIANQNRFVRLKGVFLGLGLSVACTAPLAIPASSSAQALNGQDPYERGCNKDATILASTSGGTYGIWPFQREIKVYLMKSSKCKTNWVRADVPKGTSLDLNDGSSKSYVPYQAQVNGWNYTDMWDWKVAFRACAKIPNRSKPVCTSIIP